MLCFLNLLRNLFTAPSLLGGNWLHKLKLDWSEVHKICSSQLYHVLNKHSSVFGDDLGALRGYKAHIYVDPTVLPCFHRACSIPYAMMTLVTKKLERLQEVGIIELVEFSDWAAPIVAVLKSDMSSVRICGDFKTTVNSASPLDRYPIPKIEDLFITLHGGEAIYKIRLKPSLSTNFA